MNSWRVKVYEQYNLLLIAGGKNGALIYSIKDLDNPVLLYNWELCSESLPSG